MGLKPVPFGGGLAIIADSDGQKMELDIRVIHTGARPDKARAFKLVGGAKAGFPKQPLPPPIRALPRRFQ